jgi:hypothetical protein
MDQKGETNSSKKSQLRKQKEGTLVLQDQLVGQFLSLTNLPIPLLDSDKISYYVKLFDTHYHSEHLWSLFLQSVETCRQTESSSSFLSYVSKIKEQIRSYLDKFEMVVQEFSQKQKPREVILNKKDIYSMQNANKSFVSFDVKEANYQTMAVVIRQTDPTFPETWSECVGQFTSLRFLKECKYFRQIVIGKTKLSRYYSTLCPLLFLQPLFDSLSSSKVFSDQQPVCLLHDEIVYQVETFPGMDALLPLVSGQKGQRWHVSQFRLHALSQKHSYFVKVSEETKERQLKCIQKNHACQAIKWDLHQEVEDNDLYFLTSTGETAKLIKPTLF